MNVIAQLEFKFAYYDFTVQHFNHYTTIWYISEIEHNSMFEIAYYAVAVQHISFYVMGIPHLMMEKKPLHFSKTFLISLAEKYQMAGIKLDVECQPV